MTTTAPIQLGIHDLDKVHLLLWSFSQGCFHYETLADTIESGLEAYAKNLNFQDYIVLAVASDWRTLSVLREQSVATYGRPEKTAKRE